MNKRNAIFLAAVFSLGVALWSFMPLVRGSIKARYYSGDAIEYNGQVVIGSTDLGQAEIFRLSGGSLEKMSSIKILSKQLIGSSKGSVFNDLLFNIENGRLFLYAVDGTYIYKYDVTNPSTPELVKSVKDNSRDWFSGLEKTDDRIVTVGAKGAKFWNHDLAVVDSHKIWNNYSLGNIKVDSAGRYFLNASSSEVEVYDVSSRKLSARLPIESREAHIRAPFMGNGNVIYIADDNAVRAYGLNGSLIAAYDHRSEYGYDAQTGPLSGDLFASDGVGILRLDPVTLRELDWKHTASLGAAGGWAMGMKVVSENGKERVVVFNNSSILVMDENLELVGSYKAAEETFFEEEMTLVLDKHSGMPGFNVLASGTGFGPNEDLSFRFGNERTAGHTDKNGRFSVLLTVPDIQKGIVDIKVDGVQSKLTYSTNFSVIR